MKIYLNKKKCWQKEVWNSGKLCLWDPECWTLDQSRIHWWLESGIYYLLIWSGARNLVPGIRNQWRGIQNPRLYWVPLYGATRKEFNSHRICLEHKHSRLSMIGFRKTNMTAILFFWKTNMATVSFFWNTKMATASSVWNINMAAISWIWKANMAAISLFWNTNMAAMISCKNTLLGMLIFTPYILQTTWFAKKSTVGLFHTFIYHQNDCSTQVCLGSREIIVLEHQYGGVTLCENTLLGMLIFTPYILQTIWYAQKTTIWTEAHTTNSEVWSVPYTGRKNGFASNLLSANTMQICANWGINLSKGGKSRICIPFTPGCFWITRLSARKSDEKFLGDKNMPISTV